LFSQEISQQRYLQFFTCCKHLLSTMILHLTSSCYKNAIVLDFSGDISIPKFLLFFAMEILLSVTYPLNEYMTWSSAKRVVFIFVVVDKALLSGSLSRQHGACRWRNGFQLWRVAAKYIE
jgi:hypothetical protein